jgi:hypothetical protein
MEKITAHINELNLILKDKRDIDRFGDFFIIDKCNDLYFETIFYLSKLENINLRLVSKIKLHYIYKDRIENVFKVKNKLPWELGFLIQKQGIDIVIEQFNS